MSRQSGLFCTLLFGLTMLFAIGCDSRSGSHAVPESNARELKSMLQQDGLVLVKFGAPWCGPCREVDRELGKLAAMAPSDVQVVSINVDDEPSLAQEYNVRSIPRMLLFENGNLVKDHTGYAALDEIQLWIRSAGPTKVSDVQSNPYAES